LERHDESWRLTMISLGKRHLLSLAAAVLARAGMAVHRAQAMTTPDHLVLDVVEFSDAGGFLRRRGAHGELEGLLRAAADGHVDVDSLVDRPALAPLPARRTAVAVSHEPEDRYTVIEIETEGGGGLLHQVAR